MGCRAHGRVGYRIQRRENDLVRRSFSIQRETVVAVGAHQKRTAVESPHAVGRARLNRRFY